MAQHGVDDGSPRGQDASRLEAPAPRTWSDDQERALRLWIALARCYSTFARAVSCKVQEYGLTPPQFGVLEALYHLGPLSLGDLAGKLLVTGGNVTYVMDRLEEHGLVYRERSPVDRRIIQAKLTEKGYDLIHGVFPGHGDFIQDITGSLGEEEQEQLRHLLKKLGRDIQERTP